VQLAGTKENILSATDSMRLWDKHTQPPDIPRPVTGFFHPPQLTRCFRIRAAQIIRDFYIFPPDTSLACGIDGILQNL
jgi:hypothetical protein